MKRLLTIYAWMVLYLDTSNADNLAFGKQSKQSTTYTGSELAVNGDFEEWGDGFQCAHTYGSFNAWWAVDLGDVYSVSNILIYGRTDDVPGIFLRNFDVEVIMQPECTCDKWATFHRGRAVNCHYQLNNTMFLNITCPDNTTGRFVRVQTRGQGLIVLCEVEVFGQLFPIMTAPKTNTFRACGYAGKSYNGITIVNTVARSRLECVMFCLQEDQCCAAEFIDTTQDCVLESKADNAEETAHSFLDDPSKITYLV